MKVMTPKARALVLLFLVAKPCSVLGSTIVETINSLGAQRRSADSKTSAEMEKILKDGTDQRERAFAAFYLGTRSLDAKPEKSVILFDAALRSLAADNPLYPIVEFYRANAAAKGGSLAIARSALEDLIADKSIGSAWTQSIYESYLEILFKEGAYAKFSEAYEKYSEVTPPHLRKEPLVKAAAEAYGETKDFKKEVEVLEELAVRYPTTEGSRWAFRQLMKYSCENRSENRYYYSYKLLTALGRNATLGTGLAEFIEAAGDQSIRDQDDKVRMLTDVEKIQLIFDSRLYPLALSRGRAYFEKVKSDMSGDHRAVALLLARTSIRLRDFDAALRLFTYFNFKFPNYFDRKMIQELIADVLRYSEHFASAAAIYKGLLASNPSKDLKWNYFWSLYRGGDRKGAAVLAKKDGFLPSRDPMAPGAAEYWQGKIHEDLNESTRSHNVFREVLATAGDSYYSNLVMAANPRLGGELEITNGKISGASRAQSETVELAGQKSPLFDGRIGDNGQNLNPRLSLILDLLKVNLNEQAQTELRSLTSDRGADPFEAALRDEIARRVDDYHLNRHSSYVPLASFLAQPKSWRETTIHQEEFNILWKAFYPLPYQNIVRGLARKLAVDPYLIWSIMRAESQYNPNATSPVGARGLLQVMPYTAVKISQRLPGATYNAGDLLKPEYNIGYGAWYIKRLMNYYSENLILAIAAYNAGPAAVNAWSDRCKSCQSDEFVESIPFDETRNYVKKVLSAYARYHRIYEKNLVISGLPKLPDDRPIVDEAF
jgi:soluble lytic murein transglycosylase-like protein